ncbi:protein-export chaperone SecB [Lactobacillus amylovorus]|mgnify:CR=1 FL=1|jgi:preprotein translocase subunit SecB|uniref:Protein-export chaperone SecB n=1 Tax=Lactobacillus amylovorus TaxID=1604 RepID=A0AAW6B922_LACAM|nr:MULTISPECIES: protein-export chaperone SecB [Lactobacillus]MBM6959067.1 protein-export chaperone SecB [Lactobacillus gallinarum]MDA6089349.1 protein-export chaperone SecB [Lactobacillus amylovorus]MDB6246555.1 protein-export chaperone SecB [Lactobacillus amylovorus]HJG39012.1 protein-export chaperone SecB [Staphylococcus saprophyticus]
MAVISFENYRVLELSYKRKTDIKKTNTINLKPKILNKINIDNSQKRATVRLGVVIDEEVPFKLKVEIEGTFLYDVKEDPNKIGFKNLLNTNAVAILYPYLRSLVSSLTGMSNEFAQLILPTVNIAQMLKDNK